MKKGEIFFGRKGSDAIHPIIYLGEHDGDSFIGAMLTHSLKPSKNVGMKDAHFQSRNEKGVGYEFQFSNTRLVGMRLLKKRDWAPFRKVGELTTEGIRFVESIMGNKKAIFWEDYLIEN